ncbi:hypothetical protein [Parasitella parasitica]|uniref:Uncharacterized protein n=1 Tax=Parasitella parasitica TaxID=35722 RepID=A0A0B7N307_9FUNG|nr:hypothetical protein [Parasitella parasitica]
MVHETDWLLQQQVHWLPSLLLNQHPHQQKDRRQDKRHATKQKRSAGKAQGTAARVEWVLDEKQREGTQKGMEKERGPKASSLRKGRKGKARKEKSYEKYIGYKDTDVVNKTADIFANSRNSSICTKKACYSKSYSKREIRLSPAKIQQEDVDPIRNAADPMEAEDF